MSGLFASAAMSQQEITPFITLLERGIGQTRSQAAAGKVARVDSGLML
jgi:hypothetical protein